MNGLGFWKITPRYGYGFKAAGGTSPTNPNLSKPLPPDCYNFISTNLGFLFILNNYYAHVINKQL